MKNLPYWLLACLILLTNCDDETPTVRSIKLSSYVESFDISDLGFEPSLTVRYEYQKSGKLSKYTVLSFNPASGSTEEQRYFVFSYSGDNVEEIKGYLPSATSPYVSYFYEYLPNNEVSKITQNGAPSGINSEVTFAYGDNGLIKASYVFSNGGSFEYEFDKTTGNVLSDKTTRGAQLCSEGQYTYDLNKNPFNNLGYVDYLLTNLSMNNKLTESVSYVGCAFPALISESYEYEYNEQGYPITATTFYKSDGGIKRSKKEFFYSSEN